MSVGDGTSVSTAVEVAAPIARAFHVFTAEIGTWWDPDHHLAAAPLAEMVFEPFVGGHIIDRCTDGSECRWARVLVYEPPRVVVFSWDINLRWEIETDLAKTSEVEIAFTEVTPERTRIVLTHRHLDRHGEGWQDMRAAVGRGWRLGLFADRIDQADQVLGRRLPVISDATMRARLGGTAAYTAVLLKSVGDRDDNTARIVWEHGRRNMALAEAGLLAVVLPTTDDSDLAGIGVFAATPAETEAIMADDPGIRAGIFTYELHPTRGFPGATLP